MDKSAAKSDDEKAANEQMKLTALHATINALGEAMKTAAQVKQGTSVAGSKKTGGVCQPAFCFWYL
jgi:hypothetical protein